MDASPVTNQHDQHWLRRSFDLARQAAAHGNDPFGAVLVDQNNNHLLDGENTVHTERDVLGHAESNLLREAYRHFSPEELARCTMYASTEPCVMCAGAAHWAGIGRVVFGLSSVRFAAEVPGNQNQPGISCRNVLARHVSVVGPVLEEEALNVHLEATSAS